jgi:glycosyltransferase involved in cell wall biosynthesis
MKNFESLKIALIYDRINKYGGAERLLTSLHRLFPAAPLYTLVYNSQKAPWAKNWEVFPSFYNQISLFRSHHEILAPFAALGFESFNLNNFDLVISLTSAEAKSVITKPKTLHLCYCLTPTRYLWIDETNYPMPKILRNHLQNSDKIYAQRPDYYLAISNEVNKRIKKYYQKESQVVYPPLDPIFISPKKPLPLQSRQYYLCVGRQVAYKKIDLVIDVFNELQFPLIIIGIGNQNIKLQKKANRNVTFKNFVSDQELITYYQQAKAVISPQYEDFGLVPVEAQACGTPVIALAAGGALETVISGNTGLFFKEQNPNHLKQAVLEFETNKHQITPQNCQNNSLKFSEDRFFHDFSDKVKAIWQHHQQTYS